MSCVCFSVEEISCVNCYAYDGVSEDGSQRTRLPVVFAAGSFPAIAALVGVADLDYRPEQGDTFDQPSQTWTFLRDGSTIVVRDRPRRLSMAASAG